MKREERGGLSRKWQYEPMVRSYKLTFTLCVFIILLITLSLLSGAEMLLTHFGLLALMNSWQDTLVFIGLGLVSLAIGTLLSYLLLHMPLRPIKRLLAAMARLTDGHFEERLPVEHAGPEQEVAEAFNTLASELQEMQILRTDFVNNFSHEFKTPIVSINGFAKLLQRGNLTPEQQREYIDIIAEESTRLADMAANVLSLTRVENQTILSNVKEYNLSEQLRKCLLVLEKKWEAKELDLAAEFQEYMLRADPELMQQVWVNLLDNAIKFSPQGGRITVSIQAEADGLLVGVANQGPMIPPEDQKRLFDKFWQGDTSHAAEGTGVGLSVVKRIVELHKGRVSVASSEEETVFVVQLPNPD